MQFSPLLLLTALAGGASAQRVFAVLVGANGTQKFSPDNLKVNPGDMVQFQFVGGNHTATQSTFDQPCQPVNNFNQSVAGFHTGFMPAAASSAMAKIPSYTVMINSTAPIWVYCAQAKHCEGGMTMVINENTAANQSRSLANYKQIATGANTVVPNGVGGGQSNQNGQGTGTGQSGSSSLAIPSTLGLLIFTAGAMLL